MVARLTPNPLEQLTAAVSQTLARVHAALDDADERRLTDARDSIQETIARLEDLENRHDLDREQIGLLREHILRLGGVLRTLNRIK
jgi:hypothetical protein